MPIIEIKTLPQDIGIDIPKILRRLTIETAKVINFNPEHIWATWEFLNSKHYAFGQKLIDRQSTTTHSPIIRLLSFEGKQQSDIEKILKKIAEIISIELNIDSGNIFIEYVEGHSGKIYDGGQIIYSKIQR